MASPSFAADASPSRRARNKARTRAAILAAARACFTASGVAGTTMEQIAATADVSRATLFNYFGSKRDIVDTLVAEIDAGFHAALAGWRSMDGPSTAARLLGLFAATAHYLGSASPIERLLLGASWTHWNEASGLARTARVIAGFRGLLEDGRARGDVSPGLDLAIAAEIVTHAYLGMTHAWRMEEDYPIGPRMRGAARMLAAMLATEAGYETGLGSRFIS